MDSRGNETQAEYEERERQNHDRDEDVVNQEMFLAFRRAPRKPRPVVNPEIRTNAATRDWKEARRLAEQNGLRLLRQSRSHYQLMMPDRAWVLNIFPGPCLLRRDVDRPPPYIELARIKWTLREVVEAMIVRLGCPKPKEDPQE